MTWGDVEDAHGAALTGWSVEWNKTNAEFQRGSAPLGDSTDHDFPYSGSWSRLVGPDAREFRITNLTAGNYYAVGVRAINRQGAAPPAWYTYERAGGPKGIPSWYVQHDIKDTYEGRRRAVATCPYEGVVECSEGKNAGDHSPALEYVKAGVETTISHCLLYTSPSPRDRG